MFGLGIEPSRSLARPSMKRVAFARFERGLDTRPFEKWNRHVSPSQNRLFQEEILKDQVFLLTCWPCSRPSAVPVTTMSIRSMRRFTIGCMSLGMIIQRWAVDAAPIVKFDTEEQFVLLRGRSLSEAMLGAYGNDDATRFAEARHWLAEQGITIEATNWRELSAPECAARPDTLHLAFCNEKRIAAGLKPAGWR
jgi:hypothetical protein